jgi:hypothetical protein
VSIYGWVGRIGHGKTMMLVREARELAKLRGAVLASNIGIRPPEGVRFELLPMDGFSAALEWLIEDCRERKVGLVLAVDEIDTVWDAHEWQAMSKADRFAIKQSRKLGVDVLWSCQFVDQVEKSIRNITEEVTLMRAFPAPTIRKREKGWRPWFFVAQRFRPGAVRDLMATKMDPDKRLGRSIIRYRRAWELYYDTDELVRPPVRAGRKVKRGTVGDRYRPGWAGADLDRADEPAASVPAVDGPSTAPQDWASTA